MAAHAVLHGTVGRKLHSFPLLPLAGVVLLLAALATFVSYVLWPTWPKATATLDALALPVTVAGVLFNVPQAAIRVMVQRQPGAHERIDLAFLWRSLAPPSSAGTSPATPQTTPGNEALPLPDADDRIFVTIAPLGTVLAPAQRLRTIYPRYIEMQATAEPEELAIVPFRTGTPYEGEDLVYLAEQPEQFFARCTRATGVLPGTCVNERSFGAAEITVRFPRQWLRNWRRTAAGFERLMALLHPQADDERPKPDAR